MNENWVPVLFVAIIVIGVVGGSLMQMVLKELLPLLRGMAEQRRAAPAAPVDVERLSAALETVERRLASLEAEQRRLREDAEFINRLHAPPAAEAGAGEPSRPDYAAR